MKRDKEFRVHHKERVVKNRKTLMKLTDFAGFGLSNRHLATPDGRLAKRHPYDCGNPKCKVCHYSKFNTKYKRKRRVVGKKVELDD